MFLYTVHCVDMNFQFIYPWCYQSSQNSLMVKIVCSHILSIAISVRTLDMLLQLLLQMTWFLHLQCWIQHASKYVHICYDNSHHRGIPWYASCRWFTGGIGVLVVKSHVHMSARSCALKVPSVGKETLAYVSFKTSTHFLTSRAIPTLLWSARQCRSEQFRKCTQAQYIRSYLTLAACTYIPMLTRVVSWSNWLHVSQNPAHSDSVPQRPRAVRQTNSLQRLGNHSNHKAYASWNVLSIRPVKGKSDQARQF